MLTQENITYQCKVIVTCNSVDESCTENTGKGAISTEENKCEAQRRHDFSTEWEIKTIPCVERDSDKEKGTLGFWRIIVITADLKSFENEDVLCISRISAQNNKVNLKGKV